MKGRFTCVVALGAALGFFPTSGAAQKYVQANLVSDLTVSGGPVKQLNSPWGVVWTPRDFGHFSNSIVVGNFRSGWIAAFNGFTYKFEGFLKNTDDSLLTIDHLWSLTFGNDGPAGPATTLYFTARINDEADGLFGNLVPAVRESDGSIE